MYQRTRELWQLKAHNLFFKDSGIGKENFVESPLLGMFYRPITLHLEIFSKDEYFEISHKLSSSWNK